MVYRVWCTFSLLQSFSFMITDSWLAFCFSDGSWDWFGKKTTFRRWLQHKLLVSTWRHDHSVPIRSPNFVRVKKIWKRKFLLWDRVKPPQSQNNKSPSSRRRLGAWLCRKLRPYQASRSHQFWCVTGSYGSWLQWMHFGKLSISVMIFSYVGATTIYLFFHWKLQMKQNTSFFEIALASLGKSRWVSHLAEKNRFRQSLAMPLACLFYYITSHNCASSGKRHKSAVCGKLDN